MTLIELLNRIPPNVCRLMASKSHGKRAMTHRDISRKSGIPLPTVALISIKTSWDKVPIGVASRFAEACGVDLTITEAAIRRKVTKTKMAHIYRAKGRQKEFLVRLMNQPSATEKS